jgi:hypothetical protein
MGHAALTPRGAPNKTDRRVRPVAEGEEQARGWRMADNYRRVFTIEVDGRPVATFEVRTFSEAQSLLKEIWRRADLASLNRAAFLS